MNKKRHSAEEIIGHLRRVEVMLSQGRKMDEALREIAVTANTYYRWRKEYGGLGLDQARRLKELETENNRLRRAVSELTLDKQILKEISTGKF